MWYRTLCEPVCLPPTYPHTLHFSPPRPPPSQPPGTLLIHAENISPGSKREHARTYRKSSPRQHRCPAPYRRFIIFFFFPTRRPSNFCAQRSGVGVGVGVGVVWVGREGEVCVVVCSVLSGSVSCSLQSCIYFFSIRLLPSDNSRRADIFRAAKVISGWELLKRKILGWKNAPN